MPSAFFRALGKHRLCRVYTMRHSANIIHSANRRFAECQKKGTQQTTPRHSANTPHSVNQQRVCRTCVVRYRVGPAVRPLPSACPSTLGKEEFAECHSHTLGSLKTSPSASPGHSANSTLCRVPAQRHSANSTLCRVFLSALGKKKNFPPTASTLFLLPT